MFYTDGSFWGSCPITYLLLLNFQKNSYKALYERTSIYHLASFLIYIIHECYIPSNLNDLLFPLHILQISTSASVTLLLLLSQISLKYFMSKSDSPFKFLLTSYRPSTLSYSFQFIPYSLLEVEIFTVRATVER